MIILVTTMEKDKRTGRDSEIVSHGIDTTTGQRIVLPPLKPREMGEYHEGAGEWVLFGEGEKKV